ncbi:MAG: gluconokinase [Herminiimonas sp.]|nr:gluconokinase [Herminiimonas sp.]
MQRTVVMIGVSGCGKSEIGQRLAVRLDCRFVEGDALHAPASIAKMAAGIALDDADRKGWLLRLQMAIAQALQDGETIVVSCSALKRCYRQILRVGDASLVCIHLQAGRDLLQARMAARQHFMPVALLESQLRDLEPLMCDERGICIDVGGDATPQAIVGRIVTALELNQ